MNGSHKNSESKLKTRKPELVALRERQRNRNRAVGALGVLVVLATAMALMVPAITMAHGDLICGMEEHQHSDACYGKVLTCTQEESETHAHTDACYENQLICGKDAHTHNDTCYAAPEPEPAANAAPATEPAGEPAVGQQSGSDTGAANQQPDNQPDVLANGDGTSQQPDNQPSVLTGGTAGTDGATAGQGTPATDVNTNPEFPAQTFEANLVEKDGDKEKVVLTVSVDAPEGALPPNTAMKIDDVDAEKVASDLKAAISYDTNLKDKAQANRSIAVKITFTDADNNKVEPAEDVKVKIWSSYVTEFSATEAELEGQGAINTETSAVVFSEDGAAEGSVVEPEPKVVRYEKPVLIHVLDAKKAKEDGKLDPDGKPMKAEVMNDAVLANWDDEDKTKGHEDTFKFEEDEAGTFVITELVAVETKDAVETADADNGKENTADNVAVEYPAKQLHGELKDGNDNVTLTVDVDAPEGALPEGVTMQLTPVTKESVLDAVKDAAAAETDIDAKRAEAIAVDITFFDANEKMVEPLTDVRVVMTAPVVAQSADENAENGEGAEDKSDAKGQAAQTTAAPTSLAVVHVADDETVEVMKDADTNAAAATAEFDSAKFSIYAIVYTVDFHYEIDGKTFDFSIQGGDAISLKELLVILKAVESDKAQEFVNDIASVEFSNPELIHVSKVEEDATAGAIKKEYKLEPEYSGNLTEEQITAIDAKEFKAIDWALTTLKAFDTEESLTITMTDGEVFVIKVTDARDPLGLEGKSYAIVNRRYENNALTDNWYALKNASQTNASSRGHYMDLTSSNYVSADAAHGGDGKDYCLAGATTWEFEYLNDGYYRVKCNGQYLYIDPNVSNKTQTTTNPDDELRLVNEAGNGDPTQDGTCIKITRDNNGNYTFSNHNNLCLWDYGNGFWLSNPSEESSGEQANGKMRLCTPREQDKADMISAADLASGQTVVVYQKVWNESKSDFDYYAIDGAGDLVQVYQSSNAVYWLGSPSIEWTLTDLGSGYYELRNTVTNMVLGPQSTGVVHDKTQWGVNLPGKEEGTYSSKIGAWDTGANTTYGFSVGKENNAEVLQVVPYLDSQEFMFAVSSQPSGDTLKEVATVDSVEKGITIKMYDFSDSNTTDSGNRLQFMNEVLQTNQWAQGVYRPGIVDNVLGSDGYPISTNHSSSNNGSLSNIFESAGHATPAVNANHLFLQSVYDATGFFKYSAFDNYAYLKENGDFAVYEQIGTPWVLPRPGHPNDEGYHDYYARGNFLPYNKLSTTEGYRPNEYDPDLVLLPDSDPRKGENLYYVDGHGYYDQNGRYHNDVDYFFGMTMEAKFTQNPGGLSANGDPMVYEFNGDDDLWIFIDDVLILDLGGVHDAFRGKIDFRTGKVTVRDGMNHDGKINGDTTYIMEQFWRAQRYPNGDPWTERDAEKEALYFTGPDEDHNGLIDSEITPNGQSVIAGTFKDYSTHDFNMFYMERGAGASNLDMQFNLPVLTGDQFSVKKEMPSTASGGVIQNKYADAEFYYQAKIIDGNGERYATRAEFPSLLYDDGTPVVWKADDVFALKPGRTVVFPVANSTVQYWVEEVEPEAPDPATGFPGSDMLNNFWVTNSDQDTSVTEKVTLNGVEYDQYKKTLSKTVKQRGGVVFTNKPDEGHVNELQIVKELDGELIRDANGDLIADEGGNGSYFEYKVYLEGTDGKMVPYSLGGYYQIDGTTSTADTPHYVRYKPDPRDSTKSIRVTATVVANTDGTYTYTYDTYTDGGYSYQPETETLPRLEFTNQAGQNGAIADIRPGDKILIPGLLEGTDFVVDERTDRTHIATGLTEDAGKEGQQYIFEGTTVENAYIRPNINAPQHLVGSIYDPPDYSGITYDQNRAALATILPASQTGNNDALVTVKNRGNHGFGIELEKRWSTNFTEEIKNNAKVTFTVQRYKLAAKAGSITLNGTLVNKPDGATPVYKIIKDDVVVKTVPFNMMTPTNTDARSITITDLPVGEYIVVFVDATQGYAVTSASDPEDAKVTVPEDGTATVSITSTYAKQTGYFEIMKKMTGDWQDDTNFSATYTISAEGFASQTVTLTAADLNGAESNGWTRIGGSDVWTKAIGPLSIGAYTVTEAVTGGNNDGTHTPESQSVTVVKGESTGTMPIAVFTGSYEKPSIPFKVHTGHTSSNAFSEDHVYTYEFSPGKTISVPLTFKNCQYYGGHYNYYSNPEGNTGTVTAFHDNSQGASNQSITVSIPSNATSFDLYIQSPCDNGIWAPEANGAPTETRGSRAASMLATRGANLMMAAAGNSLRADGGAVTAINNVSGETLPANTDSSKKYVLDDSWQMQVDMTANTYTQRIGAKSDSEWSWTTVKNNVAYTGDSTIPSVPWHQLFEHSSIVAKDANGNLYYYFISEVSENGVPSTTTPSFDMDANDSTKTQVAYFKDETDQKNHLSVYNEVTGSLKVTKNVTINGEEVGEDPTDAEKALFNQLVDGTYSFTIVGPGTAAGGQTLTIEITDGVANTQEIPGLAPGEYTVTEVAPTNGTSLVGSNSVTRTVEAGKIGNEAPVASFTNNINTTQVTVSKTWSDGAEAHADDVIEYTLYRIPYTGEGDDLVEYAPEVVEARTLSANTTPTAWSETIENLPKSGSHTLEDETKISVSYRYFIAEKAFDGYKSVVTGGENNNAYSFVIANEPHSSFDKATSMNIQKVWKKTDSSGNAVDDQSLHENDNITFQLVQKKYVAQTQYSYDSTTYTVPIYPVNIQLVNGDGSTSNLSKTVYVPQNTTLSIGVTSGANGNGVRGAGFDSPENSKPQKPGTTFIVNSVNSAKRVQLSLTHENHVWTDSSGTPSKTQWKATVSNSHEIVIEENQLLQSLYLDEDSAVVSDSVNYTLALNEAHDNTVITPSDNATGTGVWQGTLSDLSQLEYSTTDNAFYVYKYDVTEFMVGTERVGATTVSGFDGETSGYYVDWSQDGGTGAWTITNQKKPAINVVIHKVDKANLNAEDFIPLSGAKFQLVKYTSLNPKTKDMSWGTEGVSAEVSESPAGVFSFAGLEVGYYEIVETNPPDGYIKPTENPIFLVHSNTTTNEMEAVLIHTSGDNMGQPIDGNATDTVRIGNNASGTTVTYGNTPGKPLPNTGGMGTTLLTIVGAIMVALAAATLIFGRRPRVVREGAPTRRVGRRGGLR